MKTVYLYIKGVDKFTFEYILFLWTWLGKQSSQRKSTILFQMKTIYMNINQWIDLYLDTFILMDLLGKQKF